MENAKTKNGEKLSFEDYLEISKQNAVKEIDSLIDLPKNFESQFRPLDIDEIDFRVQSINKAGYATILAYKDARADMKRLDEKFSIYGWQKKYEVIKNNLYCSIGILNPLTNEWVWKQDVGTESLTEKTKGEASDAFKRACFNLGIGRELYDYPIIQIKLNANEFELTDGRARQTFNLKLKDWKWFSQWYNGKLTYLACKDENGKKRFEFGSYTAEL